MSDLDLIYGTKPKTVSPSIEKEKKSQYLLVRIYAVKLSRKKANKLAR
jgi:hypothetical protein